MCGGDWENLTVVQSIDLALFLLHYGLMSLDRLMAKRLIPDEITREIENLVADLLSMEGLFRMFLCGSAAEGKMAESSDLWMSFWFLKVRRQLKEPSGCAKGLLRIAEGDLGWICPRAGKS